MSKLLYFSAVEFVFALMIIYYAIEELLEIVAKKLEYFQSFWNCLDLFVISVSFNN